MKPNEIIRRYLLQHIMKKSASLVSEMLADVQADVTFTVEEKDIKAALKWLQRNGFIEASQSNSSKGQFGACERKVLKKFP